MPPIQSLASLSDSANDSSLKLLMSSAQAMICAISTASLELRPSWAQPYWLNSRPCLDLKARNSSLPMLVLIHRSNNQAANRPPTANSQSEDRRSYGKSCIVPPLAHSSASRSITTTRRTKPEDCIILLSCAFWRERYCVSRLRY